MKKAIVGVWGSWLAVTGVVATAAACSSAPDRLTTARQTRYDGSRVAVVREVAAVVAKQYAGPMDVHADAGTITTAWHAVFVRGGDTNRNETPHARPFAAGIDATHNFGGDHRGIEAMTEGGPAGPTPMTPRPREAYRFVRFEVTVEQGPPWRVAVAAQGAQINEAGGKAEPIAGPPPKWLAQRARRLELAIHERLRPRAARPGRR